MKTKKGSNTITARRAKFLRYWLLTLYLNDEEGYARTLWEGIPDGETLSDVIQDLESGFYDDDLDDMLHMYDRVLTRYGNASGWFINGQLYHRREAALHVLKVTFELPELIYKKR